MRLFALHKKLFAPHQIIYVGSRFGAEWADLITLARPPRGQFRSQATEPASYLRLAGSPCSTGDTTGKGVMMRRVWIAGAAVIAAVAAFPLTQSGQVSAKAAAAKVAGGQASLRAEQTRSQPEARSEAGRVVRVVYPSPITPR